MNVTQGTTAPSAVTMKTGDTKREAAIKAFNAASASPQVPASTEQAQQYAVQNPSQVSPEEVTAVRPQESVKSATPEATPTPTDTLAEPPKDTALSKQFAHLARQERILRQRAQQQAQELKTREQALQVREQALQTRSTEPTEGYISRDQLKQDTLRTLVEAGVDSQSLYNQMTEQLISPQDPRVEGTIKRLEAKIAQLEEANKKAENTYADQQKVQYQVALKQIETDVKKTIQNDPNFETIKMTNSVKDVVELIEQTYNKDGIVLDVEEACQEVENYLVDEALKLTRIGKIKGRLQQSAQAATPQKQQPTTQQPQMKTLTNAVSSTRKLSAKERAILAFNGQLKS